MTNDNPNNETLLIHGFSGSVLIWQPLINSEKFKGSISITQFLNVIDWQYILLERHPSMK